MKESSYLSIIFFTLLILSIPQLVYCSTIINDGSGFLYDYSVLSSGTSGQKQGDVLFTVLSYNQSTLIIQAKSSSTTDDLNFTIKYEDGIPFYIERFEALIYLPPECIAEILNNNLDWLNNLNTENNFSVSSKTSQALNYTVGAGTFQSVKLTLSLAVGIEFYGTVNLIYDIDSGVLIYSDWIHDEGGDRTVHVLMDTVSVGGEQNLLFNILSLVTIFFLPISTIIHQTKLKYNKTSKTSLDDEQNNSLKSTFPKKSFYLILTGTLLTLLSFFIPWSKFSDKFIYLPFSPPLIIIEQIRFSSLNNFNLISLIIHISMIILWVSVILFLYKKKKVLPQLLTVLSIALNLVGVIVLTQSNWTPYLGIPIILAASIFLAAGLIGANLKIEVVKEETSEEIKEE